MIDDTDSVKLLAFLIEFQRRGYIIILGSKSDSTVKSKYGLVPAHAYEGGFEIKFVEDLSPKDYQRLESHAIRDSRPNRGKEKHGTWWFRIRNPYGEQEIQYGNIDPARLRRAEAQLKTLAYGGFFWFPYDLVDVCFSQCMIGCPRRLDTMPTYYARRWLKSLKSRVFQ